MTNNYDKHRWMKWLPDPIKREDQKVKNVGINDVAFSLSIYPMSLALNEQPWTFASNGAASLMVRDHVEWRQPNENQRAMIEGLLIHEIRGKAYSLSAFKRWLGQGWDGKLPCSCAGDWAKNCPSCFGIGKRQTRCHSCQDVHDCACKRCEGGGILYCPTCTPGQKFDIRPGSYRQVVFDRALLARFLAHVPAEPTTKIKLMAEGRSHPVWVEHENGDWRAVIMPLREPEAGRVSEWTGV
jgi:hypothetical protein